MLLGRNVWTRFSGKVVLDFGCGSGEDAIEIAQHGARRVIGVDIREHALRSARDAAARMGVADRTAFVTRAEEPVDVVVSLDAFEHFGDPGGVLRCMARLLKPRGSVLISFGPPWLHPLGGHLFSVFPWSHLVFTERALMRWRSEFKTDGAHRFGEVDGGLNQMTLRRFQRTVRDSPFVVEELECIPIRRCRPLSRGPFRELFTSTIRCRLALTPA
jgi:SAM-dependent methyltransferase